MPHRSVRERTAHLDRLLLSRDRFVAAKLEVRSHEDEPLLVVGACWDATARRYVDRPVEPHIVYLQESQLELARGFARWLNACRRGDSVRPRSIFAGGNRGSGKTWFLAGVGLVVIALEWPGSWQFGVNIMTKHRAECLDAIREVARPEWVTYDDTNPQDPHTDFLTSSTVHWLSSRNPGALRMAKLPIRHVLINEGQDQPEKVFINAIASIRNTGGLVSVATNPPSADSGDWVASVWQAIEAEEVRGERYLLDNKLNRAIDQEAQTDIGAFIRAVNRDSADADIDGIFKLSGPIAYPGFKALPRAKGGHIGDRPDIGWEDVTSEITAALIGSSVGYDFICGTDWQSRPGIVGQIAKLYRSKSDRMLLLHVLRTIGVRGVEPDFSQALIAAGFVPAHGMAGAPLLVVGDATGARQNARHNWSEPVSFIAMRADGWVVVPPDYHWKTGTPWNPLVSDSRAQMHLLFERNQILYGEQCRVAADGFPSLVESTRRAKVGPRGGLIEKGGFQHCPDGVRYIAWAVMPRPEPPKPGGLDVDSFNEFDGIRLLNG